jgi:glycosyltransferase involved in cell wall biosynthesis
MRLSREAGTIIVNSMTLSILIIAHNEESHIRECIESVLSQSKIADEIILIAHNCTDKTADIAREYSTVSVLEHQTIEK